jgi:hypothetical protein
MEKLYDIVEVLIGIAETHGVSAAPVALAWLIGRPGVSSVVIGARTDAQLQDNLGAADLVLTAAEHSQLDTVSRPPLPYPYWHQANARGAGGAFEYAGCERDRRRAPKLAAQRNLHQEPLTLPCARRCI